MRLLLTGGGTGGHIYPAISVAEALRARLGQQVEFLFAGTRRGDAAALAARAGLPFVEVRAAPVRGRGPAALARSVVDLGAGAVHSWRLAGRFRPNAVLATGGYASVPVALGARLRRIPLVVYLPDVYPGWAVKLLARLAIRVATTTDAARRYLPPGKTAVTGYPVRAAFFREAERRAETRCRLGIPAEAMLLLVTGATQGARVINRAVFDALPTLLPVCIVVHQTGPLDVAAAQKRAAALPESCRDRYRPTAYIDNMPALMAAADLVVMRAGASSLAEPPAAHLPAVLVPASYAGAHQRHNAAYMAKRGAAVVLEEAQLGDLGNVVLRLLADPEELSVMRGAMAALARPDAADAIADVLLGVVA